MAKKSLIQNNYQQGKFPSSEKDSVSPLNLKDELFNQLPNEIWQQLINRQQENNSRQILPGETIKPNRQEENYPPTKKVDFFPQNNLEEVSLNLEAKKQIVLIRQEIKAIVDQLDQTNQQVEEIKTEAERNIPQESQYQFNFLAQLLEFLGDIRQRIEEGNTWLATFQKKSQKRNYYWNQTKKHGAKFMLSSDRTPATQVG